MLIHALPVHVLLCSLAVQLESHRDYFLAIGESNSPPMLQEVPSWVQDFVNLVFSYRVAMFVPAMCGLVYALFVVVAISDEPITEGRKASMNKASLPKPSTSTSSGTGSAAKNPLWTALGSLVVWQLAICYFAIGLTRSFFGDWGAVFIKETYGAFK